MIVDIFWYFIEYFCELKRHQIGKAFSRKRSKTHSVVLYMQDETANGKLIIGMSLAQKLSMTANGEGIKRAGCSFFSVV